MAGAVVQTGYSVDDSGASSTTISVTLTGVVAGNTLYAHVGGTDTGSATCTVSDGTAFTAGDTKRRSTGDSQSGWTFYRENVGAGSHTITATFGSSIDFRRLRVAELSGLATSSSKDQAVGQAQASPGTGANGIRSGATSATTNANDFIVGSTQDADSADPGSGTLSAGTGFSASGTNVIMGLESKSVSATGAQTATFTQSAAGSRITHVIAFKEAAGGQTLNPGLASETDTAFTVGKTKKKAAGQPSETDTAFAAAHRRSFTVGLASTTDTAFALVNRLKAKAVGLATDTSTAFSIVTAHFIAVGQAIATDTAMAVSRLKSKGVGQPSETDTAFSATPSTPPPPGGGGWGWLPEFIRRRILD